MIKVNDKVYDGMIIRVSWGEFSTVTNGQKRKGIAPFITFNSNEIRVGLELVFSDVMFREMKLNNKIDISKYLTDITFEDKEGWISLGNGEYKGYITRIDEEKFKIEMFVVDKYEDDMKIELDEIVKVFG